MLTAVRAKFRQYPNLQETLLGTGNRPLIQNHPKDAYWGSGGGDGKNKFGKILETVRSELRGQRPGGSSRNGGDGKDGRSYRPQYASSRTNDLPFQHSARDPEPSLPDVFSFTRWKMLYDYYFPLFTNAMKRFITTLLLLVHSVVRRLSPTEDDTGSAMRRKRLMYFICCCPLLCGLIILAPFRILKNFLLNNRNEEEEYKRER